MGGGNGAKSAQARAKNAAAAKAGPSSQLKANASAMNIQCFTCKQTFMSTTKLPALEQHIEKHKGKTVAECFPTFTV